MATCGAVIRGGASLACFCGPPAVGVGWVGTSGGVMCRYGASNGSGKCAGGAAISQERCWATCVASAVGVGPAGVAVSRVAGGVGAPTPLVVSRVANEADAEVASALGDRPVSVGLPNPSLVM